MTVRNSFQRKGKFLFWTKEVFWPFTTTNSHDLTRFLSLQLLTAAVVVNISC